MPSCTTLLPSLLYIDPHIDIEKVIISILALIMSLSQPLLISPLKSLGYFT
jgi:hypothetical protein